MPTVNERLLDQAIHHAIDLGKYSNGVVRRMISLLNRLDADLVARITEALLQVPEGSFTLDRLESLLGSVRNINAAAYREVFDALPREMRELAGYEADFQSRGLRAVFPADARARIQFATVTVEQVYAAAMSRPFQGGLLKDWAKSGEESRMKAVRNAIRMGFVEGKTTDQIVRTIRGTRAKQYKDGLLDRSRRDVESVVRTALSHTASTARDQVYEANADVIKAVGWVSTLDGRTSPMCRIRDGKRYTADAAHKPIGHTIPWLQGPGRLHFCCRSCSAPITKSFKELGIDIEELSPSTRASMDGQVPAETTYSQWIKRQSVARQDEILGPERGALLRSGGMSMDQMYSPRGDFLTLDQLRAKDAAAFERAGLDGPVRPPKGQPQDEIAQFLRDPGAQRKLLDKLYGSEGSAAALNLVGRVADREGWKAGAGDLAAIRHYTGNAFEPINRRMRESGGTLEDRQFSAMASRGAYDLPNETGEVWRAPARRSDVADRLWAKAVVGEELDIGTQLQSFSRSKDFATAWAGKGDVLLHIRKPKRAAYIEAISANPGEEEVLFPMGLRYRVAATRMETVNGRPFRVIELEVVI